MPVWTISNRKIVETLVEIERRFDVNLLYYKELQAWPLIRMEIRELLLSTQSFAFKGNNNPVHNQDVSSSFLKSFAKTVVINFKRWPIYNCLIRLKSLISQLRSLLIHLKQVALMHLAKPIDCLFFTLSIDHLDQVAGKVYCPYIDTIIELVKGHYKFLKIEIGCANEKGRQLRSEPTVYIDETYYLSKLSKRFDDTDTIEYFDDLQKVVLEVTNGDLCIDKMHMIKIFQLFEVYQDFFEKFLSAIQPKVVFLIGYHYIPNTPLITACKKLKIKTVDIQHGYQGESHYAYARWTRVPISGYELLPDYFWNWSQLHKETIEKWRPPGFTHHQPLVGGNLWLGKCQSRDMVSLENKKDPFYDYLKTFDKVVLVTTDFVDPPLPLHLIDVMQRSPKSWLWLIRLHPNQRRFIKQIESIIEKHEITNYEIDNANSYYLYDLLERSDYHISFFSTVSFEVSIFNIQTIIVHPVGFEDFREFIERGLILYADNADKLMELLDQAPSKDKIGRLKHLYFETDISFGKKALHTILDSI